MADTGQLALLLHDGIDAWNAWRKQHQGIVPNPGPQLPGR